MKRYLHAWAMCRSMFCAIPSSQVWDEDAKELMLLFLPVVGLEIGLYWMVLGWFCRILPPLIGGAVMCAYPYLVTGFIHLDGFMDVTDAVKSWRDPERRREILKDAHVGSFSVISVCLLMIAQFALFASVSDTAELRLLALIPAMSRCCSALAVETLRPMSTSQYAKLEKRNERLTVLNVQFLAILLAGFCMGMNEAGVLLCCMAAHLWFVFKAYRSLGGMNGDISGYALTISELCAVAMWMLL